MSNVKQAQDRINFIVEADKAIVATLTRNVQGLAAMNKLGVKVPDWIRDRVNNTSANVAIRQQRLKEKAKDGSLSVKLMNAPKAFDQYATKVLQSSKNLVKNAWDRFSSLFGIEGLGEPVTFTLTAGTIATGMVLTAAVSMGVAILVYKFFEPDYKQVQVDRNSLPTLQQMVERGLKEGWLTQEQAKSIWGEVDKTASDAYTQGTRDQWSESTGGMIKTVAFIGVTGAAIIWGLPKLTEAMNKKAA